MAESDVYLRVRQLEQELLEFQDSSKELEQALEEELQQLEEQNSTLEDQCREKDLKISELSTKIVALTLEINSLTEELDANKRSNEQIISILKQQLVAIEILNDDMVSHDRVLEQKLALAQQFNNELLEKLALVENDLELEKDVNAKQRLVILNLENASQIQEGGLGKLEQSSKLTKLKRDSTLMDLTMVDGTILDINEMLASEPPKPQDIRQISKLGSLHMIHELYSKSDALLNKVEDLNTTLKSGSTTETQMSTAKRDQRTIVNSPSISNLSKIQRDSWREANKENQKAKKLDPPKKEIRKDGHVSRKASMRLTREEEKAKQKKSRLRDVMKSMFT